MVYQFLDLPKQTAYAGPRQFGYRADERFQFVNEIAYAQALLKLEFVSKFVNSSNRQR